MNDGYRWGRQFEWHRQILVAGRQRPLERKINRGWRRPIPDRQKTYMPVDADEALAEASVSRDDVTRWTDAGWLSEEFPSQTQLDWMHLLELAFVRDVARSGLPDSLVTTLLSQLRKPYSYDSTSVAYSFHYGWVEVPLFYEEKEFHEMMDDFMASWIDEKVKTAPERLEEIKQLINETLERHEQAVAEEEDVEDEET